VTSAIARELSAGAVAVATVLVLLGLAIPLFLNPLWVSFEQGRARADAWTGYSPAEVDRVTGSLLHDLVIGPPAFDVTDATGAAVLDAREQSHLRDVRSVFGGFVALVAAAVVVLIVGARLGDRRTYWRSVRAGGRALAAVVIVLAALSLVAFDALFEVFHELLFAGGTYTFDPRTARLVQLFPDQFWSETTIVLGAVLVALAAAVERQAGSRLRRLGEAGTAAGGQPGPGHERADASPAAVR
jgi:integral membrane protein (TIGR01906 family)